MRYFIQRTCKHNNWSTSLTVLLTCVLIVAAACVNTSGPLDGSPVIWTGPVSSVQVSLAQPTLALGQSTQATVVATSADGQVVNGNITFSSQNPSVASVSSNGLVSGLSAGVTIIQATVGSRAASASITVKALAPAAAVVATIDVVLDSTSLGIGHSARAVATVMDSAGNLIAGRTITWASLSPTVATVSSSGMVTAVAAGSATIEAAVSGISGSASLAVAGAPATGTLAFHDFNDGTRGPFVISSASNVDFPDDPTGTGHGKVARILFAPTEANRSNEQYLSYITHDNARIRYGRTIWFKGDVYLPSNPLNDPNWRAGDLRKILDWQGASDDGWTGGGARWILTKGFDNQTNQPCLSVTVERQATVNGLQVPNTEQYFGQFAQDKFGFDTWHTIEVRLITNSANGVADGSLAFWLDNNTDTPDFVTPSTLNFINESWAPLGNDGLPRVGSYFSALQVGSQLSNATPLPLNQEYRYWDNITFSTTRVGH
jgi:hypothetical protein